MTALLVFLAILFGLLGTAVGLLVAGWIWSGLGLIAATLLAWAVLVWLMRAG